MEVIKYFLLLFLICFQVSISFSREYTNISKTRAALDTFHLDKSHVFTLSTGFSKYIKRDDAMSPFKYRGHSIPIELSYRYIGPKSRHTFNANFDKLRLLSSLPNYENAGLNHYVQNTVLQIGYSYLRKTFSFPKYQTDLYVGGEINSVINLRQKAYIGNNEFLMLDQFNSLGIKTQIEKRFSNNRQAAFVSLNIPFLTYALMGNTYNAYTGEKIDPLMNYIGNMLLYLAKKGDLVSFNKLVYFKTDFSFFQFISGHIGIEFKYAICYYKFSQYQNINFSKNLQSQFLVGIIGKL